MKRGDALRFLLEDKRTTLKGEGPGYDLGYGRVRLSLTDLMRLWDYLNDEIPITIDEQARSRLQESENGEALAYTE